LQAVTVVLSEVIDLCLTEKTEGKLDVATVSVTEQFQTTVVTHYNVLHLRQVEYLIIFLLLLSTSGYPGTSCTILIYLNYD